MLFHLPKQSIHKVGFTATKKIGNAVRRNRAKRRLRALFLEHSSALQDGTYIFVAKLAMNESSYQQLSNDFQKVLNRSKAFKKINND